MVLPSTGCCTALVSAGAYLGTPTSFTPRYQFDDSQVQISIVSPLRHVCRQLHTYGSFPTHLSIGSYGYVTGGVLCYDYCHNPAKHDAAHSFGQDISYLRLGHPEKGILRPYPRHKHEPVSGFGYPCLPGLCCRQPECKLCHVVGDPFPLRRPPLNKIVT